MRDKSKKAKSDHKWYLKWYPKIKDNPEFKEKRNRTWNKYYVKNKDKVHNRTKNRYYISKLIVINHYSQNNPRCFCCNESNFTFLTIDHINGNGSKHRKTLKSSRIYSGIYQLLIREKFPIGYQVLCFNCNISKGTKTKCYHQRSLFQETVTNKTKAYNRKAYNRKAYVKRKIKVLQYYSSNNNPFCKCCGENEIEFLGIDHINGGGRRHVKERKSKELYFWLMQNNFPDGYQTLCNNCNCGKRTQNHCPHTLQPKPLNINNIQVSSCQQ